MAGSWGQQRQSNVFLMMGGKKKTKERIFALCQNKTLHASIPPQGKGENMQRLQKKQHEKDCPENGLSGFLKELSWGSKQLGGSANEVMTDGISRAWHNSPI